MVIRSPYDPEVPSSTDIPRPVSRMRSRQDIESTLLAELVCHYIRKVY